jgi:hypothetical protein
MITLDQSPQYPENQPMMQAFFSLPYKFCNFIQAGYPQFMANSKKEDKMMFEPRHPDFRQKIEKSFARQSAMRQEE